MHKIGDLSVRGKLAVGVGRLASWTSRFLGKGEGGMIGGRLAQKLCPDIMAQLAKGRQVVLITGTNGKSTTTAMTTKALSPLGQVATNSLGANMDEGAIAALIASHNAPLAVLEVDEMHLGMVANATKPAAIVLLNLSRDQLDRVGEITKVERHLRQTVEDNPQAVIIANCDDPLISCAAWQAPNVVWVSAGTTWTADSVSFPRTGNQVVHENSTWWVPDSPEFKRPRPNWEVADESLVQEENKWPLHLKVPGRVNLGNAAQAVATAVALGVDVVEAVHGVEQISQVAGRYAQVNIHDRQTRILLAKNPAGWQEAITMLDPEIEALVIAVNGQVADGKDLSWLWDVSFEKLHELGQRPIFACGERGSDLAVRLRYAGFDCQLTDLPLSALAKAPTGRIDVLANYTAFRDLKSELGNRGLWKEDK